MEKNEPIPVEVVWAAMRNLADELSATHAPPFTACFFDEHQAVLERVFRQLIGCDVERGGGP